MSTSASFQQNNNLPVLAPAGWVLASSELTYHLLPVYEFFGGYITLIFLFFVFSKPFQIIVVSIF